MAKMLFSGFFFQTLRTPIKKSQRTFVDLSCIYAQPKKFENRFSRYQLSLENTARLMVFDIFWPFLAHSQKTTHFPGMVL